MTTSWFIEASWWLEIWAREVSPEAFRLTLLLIIVASFAIPGTTVSTALDHDGEEKLSKQFELATDSLTLLIV